MDPIQAEDIARFCHDSEANCLGPCSRGDPPHPGTWCPGVGDGIGDIVRVWLQDEDLNRALFDIPLAAADIGSKDADQWVHFVLSVSHKSIFVVLDGEPISTYGYPLNDCRGCEDWAQTAENLAWPDPTDLTAGTHVVETENEVGWWCSFTV